MVGTAGGAAGAVAVAVVDALCAPLSTDEIGECLRIFGNVGGQAVVADAGISQRILRPC